MYGKNEKGLVIVSASADSKEDNILIKKYIADNKILYPSASAVEGGGAIVGKTYNLKHFPTMYLIGPNGEILEKEIEMDMQTVDDLLKVLAKYDFDATNVVKKTGSVAEKFSIKNISNKGFTLNIPQNGVYTVAVTSLAGKTEHLYKSQQLQKGKLYVSLGERKFTNGVYIVKIISPSGTLYRKITVK